MVSTRRFLLVLVIFSMIYSILPYHYAYAESEDNYPTIKIGVYVIENYPCPAPGQCREIQPEVIEGAIEAAKAFRDVLIGENRDCAIISRLAGSKTINIRVCIDIFTDSDVTSEVFKDPNAPNSISNYDIVLFIGHGYPGGIVTYDWLIINRTFGRHYIPLGEIMAARNRTKWIFFYSCNTMDIYQACRRRSSLLPPWQDVWDCPEYPTKEAAY